MTTVRLGLAQMNASVGALAMNAATIARFRDRAAEMGVDLVVTPELALTGYPPEDLLLKEGFLDSAASTLAELATTTHGPVLAVGVALNERPDLALAESSDGRRDADQLANARRGRVANALAIIAERQIVATVVKRLLPNYDVFDEQRYFHAGTGPLTLLNINGVGVGLLICEDVWNSDGPAAQLAHEGAQIIVVANASPFARGRSSEREAMLIQRARETGCVMAYVNLVGGQDELVFDGASVVVNAHGEVIARAGSFEEELLIVDIEVPRCDVGLFVETTPSEKPTLGASVVEPVAEIEEVYRALVTGTRDYLQKNGFNRAVLGLSGGVDSALVAVIAADAIGAQNVTAIALPSRYSSDHSLSDARDVADRTGINYRVIEIEPIHEAFVATLAPVLDGPPEGLTDENLQARIRSVLWMAISNDTGAIVLTTGNKSEMATGYSTLYGDSAGGFAVIKDVPKTLVYELCQWRNEQAAANGNRPPIPQNVLVKAPSAELRPDQRDDQSLPPYEQLDPLLESYVEGDATAQELIDAGHDPELVMRIVRLVDQSEYKRRQMPPGVRVTKKAFGKDRRMPISNAYRPHPS